jgi:hypothetical protein
MRKRARTVLCGGRSVMVVPTASTCDALEDFGTIIGSRRYALLPVRQCNGDGDPSRSTRLVGNSPAALSLCVEVVEMRLQTSA